MKLQLRCFKKQLSMEQTTTDLYDVHFSARLLPATFEQSGEMRLFFVPKEQADTFKIGEMMELDFPQ